MGARVLRVAAWSFLATLAAAPADPPRPAATAAGGDDGPPVRLTALLQQGDRVRVGLVLAGDGRSLLLAPGQSAGDVEVLSADYDAGEARLRWRGRDLRLALVGRVVDVGLAGPAPDAALFPAGALEGFFAEFPEFRSGGRGKLLLEAPPVPSDRGETIERALAADPALREAVDGVVTGRGPTIEAILKAQPDLPPAPDATPSGLGPEIERRLGAAAAGDAR
jgi:hypothetical protein